MRDRCLVGPVLVEPLANDRMVIELARHDKLPVDVLKARSVPDAQIVLAYCGDAMLT